MTWLRNSHTEFVRVSRVPRANAQRSTTPAFGVVELYRRCARCPERFPVGSARSNRRLCKSCRDAEAALREERRQHNQAVLAGREAEARADTPAPAPAAPEDKSPEVTEGGRQ